MSDFQQCSNQLQFDLIILLLKFSCKLGHIMTIYDFLRAIPDISVFQIYLNVCLVGVTSNFVRNFEEKAQTKMGGGVPPPHIVISGIDLS